MRRQYLFDLANLCGIDSLRVDALRYVDFVSYIFEIDRFWDREEERWKAMQNEFGG